MGRWKRRKKKQAKKRELGSSLNDRQDSDKKRMKDWKMDGRDER